MFGVRVFEFIGVRRGFTTWRPLQAKENWAKLRRKKWATNYALENFDDGYKPIFGGRWPSIRLALLCQQKYCAVVNNFGDFEQTAAVLAQTGAQDIRSQFDSFLGEAGDIPVRAVGEDDVAAAGLEQSGSEELGCPGSALDDDDRLRFSPHSLQQSSTFNEFVPATKLQGLEDYVNEADFESSYDPATTVRFETVTAAPAPLPVNWKVFAFDRGNISLFPPPHRSVTGVLDYYLMDATSLLPVFALNVRSGDSILDMCSAPGGKALAILQMMHSVELTCNDESASRINRLRTVLNSYVPEEDRMQNSIMVALADGQKYGEQPGTFNKILVDVPCTTDRHAVNKNDSNIFNPMRLKERIHLPDLQISLLTAALKAVAPGGTVVYSTCTMSPIQNDGVVHMALNNMWETTSSNIVVHDLANTFHPFSFLFEFHPSPRYGQLAIPSLPRNFGPMYVCKLTKLD